MKYPFFVLLLLCFCASETLACGGWDAEDDSYYYNLFDQQLIDGEQYLQPFLRTDVYRFYGEEAVPTFDDANLDLWQKLLKSWTREELRTAVYHKAVDQTDWDLKSEIEVEVRDYLKLAKDCEQTFAFRLEDLWDYEDIMDQNHYYGDLISRAQEGFAVAAHAQIKLRYAYQIIRAYHYSRNYADAVGFYEQSVKPLADDTEIYYYAMDQAAGCYYSLGDYERAAYLFMKVFQGSRDRKASAKVSYDWCIDKGAEGKTHFSGKKDEAAHILLQGMSAFTDMAANLDALVELEAASPEVELLFMRAMNEYERFLLPKRLGMKSDRSLPDFGHSLYDNSDLLTDFAAKMSIDGPVNRHSFWALSAAYLEFLHGNTAGAKRKTEAVDDPALAHQREVLLKVFEVFEWEGIGPEQEAYLAAQLEPQFAGPPSDGWSRDEPVWKYLAMDRVGHLYYEQGELAKSFLMHHMLQDVVRISSLELLEDLWALFEKRDKSEMEQMLCSRVKDMPSEVTPKDLITFAIGHYFLQQGEPRQALPWLEKSVLDNAEANSISDYFQKLVPASVFSNNTYECYSCDVEEVMEDEVYKADLFAFIHSGLGTEGDPEGMGDLALGIDRLMQKSKLAKSLLMLDSLSNCGTKWKEKLAHYLLGNYYFNVSNTGYYRHLLVGYNCNSARYRYFPFDAEKYESASDLYARREGYNLEGSAKMRKMYHGLAKIAYRHYEEMLALSDDRELNSRTLYMMAKCELNDLYNHSVYSRRRYHGGTKHGADQYRDSFAILCNEYSGTKTFARIESKCRFFQNYCPM